MNWKGKYKDIRDYIKGCNVCKKSKWLGDGLVKLGMLSAGITLEIVPIDFITVDEASDGRESIIVITDILLRLRRRLKQ